MKKNKKYFIYFVLIAPILAKILEWSVQFFTFGGFEHISKGVWIYQIFIIESFSLLIYLGMKYFDKIKIKNMMLIPAYSYSLKEIFNLIFVYKVLGIPILIAIFIEPLVVYLILSWLPYRFIFSKKKKK